MATISMSSKGIVILPQNIRKKFKLDKGSKIEVSWTDEHILLVPLPEKPLQALKGSDREMKFTDKLRMVRDTWQKRLRH